jgi:hypothetical protein
MVARLGGGALRPMTESEALHNSREGTNGLEQNTMYIRNGDKIETTELCANSYLEAK